ncbi:unnamed protein product [Mytilus edulis]|uniref:Uncharacterized protein n=1 Tax=Mytilus edulis TaxID=6550 RepID=A0A8S3T0J4_MYTED|nr:unnamed protein product [Mytilus edulis]
MELQDEKMSFDERNFSAYLNRSYSDGFSPPPDICGKQRHSDGYLHPCNRNEKGISSNHDYLSIQGSIREESQVDKVLRPADDYCLTQDKETNKPSANSPCSPCRMIILAAIITLLLILSLLFKNETVRLIPGDSCKDNTVSQSNRVHPTNCKYYIECQNKEPYGRACQYGYCFWNIHSRNMHSLQ